MDDSANTKPMALSPSHGDDNDFDSSDEQVTPSPKLEPSNLNPNNEQSVPNIGSSLYSTPVTTARSQLPPPIETAKDPAEKLLSRRRDVKPRISRQTVTFKASRPSATHQNPDAVLLSLSSLSLSSIRPSQRPKFPREDVVVRCSEGMIYDRLKDGDLNCDDEPSAFKNFYTQICRVYDGYFHLGMVPVQGIRIFPCLDEYDKFIILMPSGNTDIDSQVQWIDIFTKDELLRRLGESVENLAELISEEEDVFPIYCEKIQMLVNRSKDDQPPAMDEWEEVLATIWANHFTLLKSETE